MKWNHLPVAGGIYDQHPRLIEEWNIIWGLRAEHDERERKKEEQKSRSGKRVAGIRRRGR